MQVFLLSDKISYDLKRQFFQTIQLLANDDIDTDVDNGQNISEKFTSSQISTSISYFDEQLIHNSNTINYNRDHLIGLEVNTTHFSATLKKSAGSCLTARASKECCSVICVC